MSDRHLPYDPDEPIWSESVVLWAHTPEGTGFSTRLCRYPSAGVAWMWAHVFEPEGVHGFNVDHVPCDDEVNDVLGADVTYAVDAGSWTRTGPRDAPEGAEVHVDVRGHATPDAPDEPGDVPITIDAEFVPGGNSGGTLPGRTEVFGRASATIRIGDRTLELSGRAHWHEQHQDAPRFRVPFTYASLQGDDLSLVALQGEKRSGGFAVRNGRRVTIEEADVRDDVIRLTLEDGESLDGDREVVQAFTIPIYGRTWRGTVSRVTAGPYRLTGAINRWEPT